MLIVPCFFLNWVVDIKTYELSLQWKHLPQTTSEKGLLDTKIAFSIHANLGSSLNGYPAWCLLVNSEELLPYWIKWEEIAGTVIFFRWIYIYIVCILNAPQYYKKNIIFARNQARNIFKIGVDHTNVGENKVHDIILKTVEQYLKYIYLSQTL